MDANRREPSATVDLIGTSAPERRFTIDKTWLKIIKEDILFPDQPIVDPHHHIWVHPSRWGIYTTGEYVEDCGTGHRVEKSVFIECNSEYLESGPEQLRPVGETLFIEKEARRQRESGVPQIGAIVGYADLMLGSGVRDVLTAHVEAGQGLFRGIRQMAALNHDPPLSGAHPPPADLYQRSDFRSGFSELNPAGLVYDAFNYHPQIPGLADLARSFSGTTIILDHLGGPIGIGRYAGNPDKTLSEWSRGMDKLAVYKNVMVKIGGLGMYFTGTNWHLRRDPPRSEEVADAYRPYFERVIERFGVDRCMFESNFPVDKTGVSYPILWNAFKRLVDGMLPRMKEALMYGTASRIYRL